MRDCSFIADASCWAVRGDSTVEEVCATKAAVEADEVICGDETIQDDCLTCTSTLKSDGTSTCQWYTPVGARAYCGTGGCDMMGVCGSEICDLGIDGPCGGFSECEPCLNSRLECAWIANRCEASCDAIMDVACYHPANFPNMTGPEICAVADEAGPGTMGPPEGTPPEGPPGGTLTPPEGVPPDVPPTDDSHPCNGFEICEPCLNSRIECAWIAGRCEPSCDVIMDVACYHPANFPNMTGPEICAIADTAEPMIMGPPDVLMNETSMEDIPMGDEPEEESEDGMVEATSDATEAGGGEDEEVEEEDGERGNLQGVSGAISHSVSLAGLVPVAIAAIAFL